MAPSPETCALLQQLMDRLDYPALGEIYCDEGGAVFWEDRRGPVVDVGLAWAAELARRLPRGGHSLYVGAGVAELPVLLTEALDLDRRCTATSLRERECELLNQALAAVDLAERVAFVAGDAGVCAEPGRHDHLCVVSVLNDPETFPEISEVTYGRASPLTLDAAAFAREREVVRALVARLLAALAPPAWLTTSIDEVPWFLERAGELGWRAEADEVVLETALVGDEIGFLRLLVGP